MAEGGREPLGLAFDLGPVKFSAGDYALVNDLRVSIPAIDYPVWGVLSPSEVAAR